MGKVKAPVIPRPKKKTEENIITLEDIKKQFQPDDYVLIFMDQYRVFYAKISEITSDEKLISSKDGKRSNVIFEVIPFLNYSGSKLDFKENNSTYSIHYSDCIFIEKTTREDIIKNLENQYLENIKTAKNNIKTLKKDIQNYQYNLRELRKVK